MKGIVFSEFIEMVEEVFSPEVSDKIIMESDLPSGGAYTSVGTYKHEEMLILIDKLSTLTDTPEDKLIVAFGKHLCKRFTLLYSNFFYGVSNSFEFLDTIENHVHVEVQKLYPDAQLPTFTTEGSDSDKMVMTYISDRPFAMLAYGLIQGCACYFKENIEITIDDLSDGKGSHARFTLTRKN